MQTKTQRLIAARRMIVLAALLSVPWAGGPEARRPTLSARPHRPPSSSVNCGRFASSSMPSRAS